MNLYLLYQNKFSNKLNQFNSFKSTFYKSRLATGPIHWLTRSGRIIRYGFKNCPISSGVYYINWPSVLGKQIPIRVSAFGILYNQPSGQPMYSRSWIIKPRNLQSKYFDYGALTVLTFKTDVFFKDRIDVR